jgi:hypothetical protein
MNKLYILIRAILLAALVYFVYQEAGFFTALSLTFIFVFTELSTMCHQRTIETIELIANALRGK